jgi:hypothetical protein
MVRTTHSMFYAARFWKAKAVAAARQISRTARYKVDEHSGRNVPLRQRAMFLQL